MSEEVPLNLYCVKVNSKEIRDLLLSWRNDPVIVALGSSNRTVTDSEHSAWLDNLVRRPLAARLFIIHLGMAPIGAVRFDRDGIVSANISIYLIDGYRGGGIGPAIISGACDLMFSEWGSLRKVYAEIKHENIASIKAFTKAGFVEADSSGEEVLMVMERSHE